MWELPFRSEVWGTVGQWVSGVFAGLSAYVALSIVRRDRRKDEWMEARRVQLDIAISCDENATPTSYDYTFTFTNGSSHLISNVHTMVTPKHPKFSKDWTFPESEPLRVIPAGKTEDVTYMKTPAIRGHPDFIPIRQCDVTLVWNDDFGLTWERDQKTLVLK